MKSSAGLYYTLVFVILAISCTEQPREIQKTKPDKVKENLISVNKFLVEQDVERIKGYISRHNLKMETTTSGLYYRIIKKGDGKSIKTGDKVNINYKISLLDGTQCYSSDKDGPKIFTVGKGGVEPGLEEGVLLLHEGDIACFILLPHLAHGLVGDGKVIPARSTIILDIDNIQIIH